MSSSTSSSSNRILMSPKLTISSSFCMLFTILLLQTTLVGAIIRTRPSAVKQLLPPTTTDVHIKAGGERNAVASSMARFVNPKTYTVGDFQLLVQGMKTEREKMDKEIEESIAQLRNRVQFLEEKQAASPCTILCQWMTLQQFQWLCWTVSCIGLAVLILGLLYLLLLCWRNACSRRRDRNNNNSAGSQDKLLSPGNVSV